MDGCTLPVSGACALVLFHEFGTGRGGVYVAEIVCQKANRLGLSPDQWPSSFTPRPVLLPGAR